MPSNVHLRDVCEVEDGLLKSIDLSKLFFPGHGELRDAASAERLLDQDVRLARLQPKPANLSSTLRELLRSPQTTSTAIVPRGELTLTTVRTSHPASHPASGVLPRVSLRPFPKAKPSPTIRPLPKATYSVKRSLDQSLLGGLLGIRERQERIAIELPLGAPRFVSAATLKVMLGADESETLFKKTGKRWEVCSDSLEVDLKDRAQVFRLGQVQIYS